jgi:hypothetical protein
MCAASVSVNREFGDLLTVNALGVPTGHWILNAAFGAKTRSLNLTTTSERPLTFPELTDLTLGPLSGFFLLSMADAPAPSEKRSASAPMVAAIDLTLPPRVIAAPSPQK